VSLFTFFEETLFGMVKLSVAFEHETAMRNAPHETARDLPHAADRTRPGAFFL
jgi:hypothetical protein